MAEIRKGGQPKEKKRALAAELGSNLKRIKTSTTAEFWTANGDPLNECVATCDAVGQEFADDWKEKRDVALKNFLQAALDLTEKILDGDNTADFESGHWEKAIEMTQLKLEKMLDQVKQCACSAPDARLDELFTVEKTKEFGAASQAHFLLA